MIDTAKPAPPVIIIVDTTEYTGNFERQLVAWMTGQVGECGVGSNLLDRARSGMSKKLRAFCDYSIVRMPDDSEYPCHRPASIWPDPTTGDYTSVATFFNKELPEDLRDELSDRAHFFGEQYHRDGELGDLYMATFREKPLCIKGVRTILPKKASLISDVLS